jgi:hypothetical protein
MSIDLDLLAWAVSVAIPTAHLLSHKIIVGG